MSNGGSVHVASYLQWFHDQSGVKMRTTLNKTFELSSLISHSYLCAFITNGRKVNKFAIFEKLNLKD